MIDIHSHILPGLDDGAEHLEQSLELAQLAVREGIHTIIATPHHADGKHVNRAETVSRAVGEMNQALDDRGIPLQVLTGQEIRMYPGFIEDAYEGHLMALHESKYFLVEFPYHSVPSNTESLFHELIMMGITPVIAHPERNQEFIENTNRLYELVESGALTQATSHSINGRFGQRIREYTLSLCKKNLIHFVASDVHHKDWRPFCMVQAYEQIKSELGTEYVKYYRRNAESIVKHQVIDSWKPVRVSKKWYRFWDNLA